MHEIQNIFKKEDEYPSLIIPDIIDSETRCCFNIWKFLLQNTIP